MLKVVAAVSLCSSALFLLGAASATHQKSVIAADAGSVAARAVPSGGDVSMHTKRSTAYVTARVNDRSQAVGSGVIIATTPNVIVLTARHIASRKNLAVKTFSGETLTLVAEYEVADRDLALIVASGPCTGCEAAQTAGEIRAGQPIHVWGNPGGRPYVLSPGTVADLHPVLPGYATNGRFSLTCDSCNPGDSGGGVFDERGRLLGIVTEGWDGVGFDKRVIAEPANQALAHVPLEYVTGPAAREPASVASAFGSAPPLHPAPPVLGMHARSVSAPEACELRAIRAEAGAAAAHDLRDALSELSRLQGLDVPVRERVAIAAQAEQRQSQAQARVRTARCRSAVPNDDAFPRGDAAP